MLEIMGGLWRLRGGGGWGGGGVGGEGGVTRLRFFPPANLFDGRFLLATCSDADAALELGLAERWGKGGGRGG